MRSRLAIPAPSIPNANTLPEQVIMEPKTPPTWASVRLVEGVLLREIPGVVRGVPLKLVRTSDAFEARLARVTLTSPATTATGAGATTGWFGSAAALPAEVMASITAKSTPELPNPMSASTEVGRSVVDALILATMIDAARRRKARVRGIGRHGDS